MPFALAHNGMLHNDKTLRIKHKLPSTKIETDSYIAVQLLEQKPKLSARTVREMAEELEGSYCFSILDADKNLYLVKGDNPLAIIHNSHLQAFFYASTEEILLKGLIDSDLFGRFKSTLLKQPSSIKEINLVNGDILKIKPNGLTEKSYFTPNRPHLLTYGLGWQSFGSGNKTNKDEHLEVLRDMAGYFGYASDIVNCLADEGFAAEEIEEFLYEGGVCQIQECAEW